MTEEAVEEARVVGQRVLLEKLGRRGVERLRILDGVQLLARLVALGVLLAAELLAQLIGERARGDPLAEEAVEVRLVLRVLGRVLEALRLAIGPARRAAAVALLVDLAPALGSLWFLVVRHPMQV